MQESNDSISMLLSFQIQMNRDNIKYILKNKCSNKNDDLR